ncbi:MAG: asparagine synthase (glutamine-hydrolyzing) [Opitutae bacterium]|nr:asparagine synthase (glutamine-hydrolyzing) [Opitutae bacterium]
MCGIAGFVLAHPEAAAEAIQATAIKMAAAMRHRGPDDTGTWADADAGLWLSHARLAILDLSPAGHQPMVSACGRYVLAFNGEIYNHLDLRAELAGAQLAWRGHADTETLLAAIVAWGLEASLQRCVGMFALALWDRRERALTLARDRFGEKPLYYGWVGPGTGRAFAFASELKALRAWPGFANPVCREALRQYLRFLYVPTPRSIYQDIYKLEPGHLLRVTAEAARGEQSALRKSAYWSLTATVAAARQQPLTDEPAALAELEAALARAVGQQSVADVPLGAFLSGGVDSSTIVALMQRQARRPVLTFTVGFEEAGFDEAPFARAVARHLGTEHHELRVTAAETRQVIPALPRMYDEPFADSSQIPTFLVCQAARRRVTVALSGDAGDELLGGYNRYFWGPRIWQRLAWLPHPARRALGRAIAALPVPAWDALGAPLNALLPGARGLSRLGDKAHKLAARLGAARDLDALYEGLVTEWQYPVPVVHQATTGPGIGGDGFAGVGSVSGSMLDFSEASMLWSTLASGLDPVETMMVRDALTYLPDDILCKVDRAAMATSLETRLPFLDHRVAELAWRLPLGMKIRSGQGKWALRQILDQYVPRELIERPKAGFAIPVGDWLRGPLRDWAEALLAEERLSREGYLLPAPVRQAWLEHLSGRRDWTQRLWAVLMFQAWLEEWS